MKAGRKLSALVLALVAGALVAGCGGGGSSSPENKELVLGIAGGWTENEAVSSLSKVVMERDLGYKVTTRTADLPLVVRGVGDGKFDAFQDVWMPNNAQLLKKVRNDVEQLDPWYLGTTKFGIAVPTYAKTADGQAVTSLDQLNRTDIEQIIGIEPGAVISEKIEENVIPDYNLTLEHEPSSTAAMLAEVERLYQDKEPFVFPPWCPNPMCGQVEGVFPPNEYGGLYDFRYLEDPKNSQGNLDEPATISSIVSEDLSDEDPVAYAFINNLRLNDDELVALENEITKAGDDPVKGAKAWLEGNRDVVQPAIDAAKQEQ